MDLGTQYHLTRYAFLYESIILSDGSILVPPREEGGLTLHKRATLLILLPGLGLKASIETIDNRADFKVYMQHYAYARGGNAPRGPRREGPSEEGFVSNFPFFAAINNLTCNQAPSYCTSLRPQRQIEHQCITQSERYRRQRRRSQRNPRKSPVDFRSRSWGADGEG